MISPRFSQIADTYTDVVFIKIDVDEAPVISLFSFILSVMKIGFTNVCFEMKRILLRPGASNQCQHSNFTRTIVN